MKLWKQTALVLLSAVCIGNMTACSGTEHVNDATKGSETGETLDEEIKNGSEDLKDDVEDGAEDLKDDVEDALDGDGKTEYEK